MVGITSVDWQSITESSITTNGPIQGSQNRSGSTGSRWNRSGPVHEPVRFPPQNCVYKFVRTVNRSVFLIRGNCSLAVLLTLVPSA
jgi:hypothetical protein